jgi:oligosaccharide repeat unit polymerase
LNTVIALTYTLFTIIALTILGKPRSNPVYWFLVFQWLMGVGVMLLMDINLAADVFLVSAYFLSSMSFFIGALFYLSMTPISKDYKAFFSNVIDIDKSLNIKKVWLIFLVSIAITFFYYMAIGSNIFLNVALGLAVEDFSTSRLAAYSSDTYFAPGYANQFKNILLPMSTSILATYYFHLNKKLSFRLILIFALFALPLALLGTGQRAFLAYSFAAYIFGLMCLNNLSIRNLLFPLIITFALFVFMTFLYKSDQINPGDNIVLTSIVKTLERFIYTEQEEVMVTFRHLFQRDTVYYYEWFDQLRGLLPGHSGSYLQHELFAERHGTDRGTAAVSTVASLIHNGSIISVPVFYFILGYLYFWIYHRFLKGRRSIVRVFGYCALFFYLSIFVSGGPSSLINNGAVTIIFFIFIRKINIRFPKNIWV